MNCKHCNGNICEINKSLCIGEEECEKAKLFQEIKELKEENKKITLEAKKLVAQYSAKLERQRKILQEIKEIAEKIMADNLCNNCDRIGLDANCQDTFCPVYQMDEII